MQNRTSLRTGNQKASDRLTALRRQLRARQKKAPLDPSAHLSERTLRCPSSDQTAKARAVKAVHPRVPGATRDNGTSAPRWYAALPILLVLQTDPEDSPVLSSAAANSETDPPRNSLERFSKLLYTLSNLFFLQADFNSSNGPKSQNPFTQTAARKDSSNVCSYLKSSQRFKSIFRIVQSILNFLNDTLMFSKFFPAFIHSLLNLFTP